MNDPALPHATPDAAAIGQASARRQAAGAPEGRKGHAPARHADARESAASGQAAQTADGEAASGRGSNCPPPRAPETARPRQRTAKRRRGGRRRRRPGGTGARLLAAPFHAVSAEKRHARTRKPRARPTQSAKGKARPQIRSNCSACIRWDAGAPARSAARRRADRPPLSVAGARDGLTAFLCPLSRVLWPVVNSYPLFAEKTPRKAKNAKKGLSLCMSL